MKDSGSDSLYFKRYVTLDAVFKLSCVEIDLVYDQDMYEMI